MKSTFFNEILDETTIQVNDSYQGAINKLRLQNGACNSTTNDKKKLRFKCSEKGKMKIENYYKLWHNVLNGRVYYASGEVLAQDNKTVVKVYSIHNRGEWLFRIIALILYFALLATCFIVQLNLGIVPQGISSILCFLGALFIMLFVLSIKENRNKYNNLEVMKEEIIKRVEAINHWEK